MAIILVGCEESQAVCIALRNKGHEAFSCDILECSGGHPEWHLKMDVFTAIKGGTLVTQSGEFIMIRKWAGLIAFPDCTYLTIAANWCYKDQPPRKSGALVGAERRSSREKAVKFFMRLVESPIEFVALENPVGVMSTRFRIPDQVIQPHQFNEDASKATCLWLKALPLLISTGNYPPRIVNGKERWGNQTDSGQNKLPPGKGRAKLRSKTYKGIAEAMASQWFK